MKNHKIDALIIDDEPLVRELLSDCLSERGLNIATAEDGQDGLAKIHALRPRVVVSDVRMPGKNGYEILHEIRKNHPELADTKFVLLTGLSDAEYVSAAYKIGADDYVTKPIADTDRFSDRIVELIHDVETGGDVQIPQIPAATRGDQGIKSSLPPEDVATRIAQTIGSLPFAYGQVVCLGVEEVKERLGPRRWDKVQDQITELIISSVNAYCGKKDMHFRCPDGSVLIIFSDDDFERANAIAARVAKRVNAALFGSDDTKGVRVEAQISEAGGPARKKPVSAEDVISAFLPIARRVGLAENGKHRPPQSPGPPPPLGDDGGRGQPGIAAKTQESEKYPSLRDKLSEKFQSFSKNPIRFMYFPIWDIERRYVGIFGCVPNRTAGRLGGSQWNYEVLGPLPDPIEIIKLDIACIEHALLAAVDHLSNGTPVVVCPNVHYETLSSRRGREQVHDLLSSMPSEMRDFVSLKVMHIPEGIPENRLAEILGQIKVLLSFLSVEIACSHDSVRTSRTIARLRSSGFQTILVRLPSDAKDTDVERAVKIAKSIQKVGAISGVLGVSNQKTLVELAYSGLEICGGRAVGEPVRTLPPPYPYDAKNLERS